MKKSIYIIVLGLLPTVLVGQSLRESYPRMIEQIISSIDPNPSETVLIRYDARLMSALSIQLAEELQPKVKSVELWPYGPVEDFEKLLDQTDIYIAMPVRRSVPGSESQFNALVDWLNRGRGRQIHFHWGDGTRNWDSTPGEHNAVYDSIYLSALGIDYQALDKLQEKAIGIMRSGPVKVTSPSGTDLTFEIADRTVTKQNGDASAKRMESARVRIEREIELPSGAIRVSPIEETVNGTLFIGTGTIAGVEVEDLKLSFEKGKVINIEASRGKEAFAGKLEQQDALNYFREIGIGFNPNLQFPENYSYVPYYGYGAGVVRLSLGNNDELGGNVKGDGVQWMFFLDATVSVGDKNIVENGRLSLK